MAWHFEISWEVSHKQGGIYTTLINKAAALSEKFKNHYFYMIGPYIEKQVDPLFKELSKPEWLRKIDENLGLPLAHYGIWNIPGNPAVILLDFTSALEDENKLNDILNPYLNVDNQSYFFPIPPEIQKEVAFGVILTRFLTIFKEQNPDENLSIEFHEWQSACALPSLYQERLAEFISFTTHATQLGRIASKVSPFFLKDYDIKTSPQWMQTNQSLKHIIEKKSAEQADQVVVTSSILFQEVQNILQVTPDKIIPPGINVNALQRSENLVGNREKLHGFLQSRSLIPAQNSEQIHFKLLIGARHEFHNKGFDVTLKSIALLNQIIRLEQLPWRATLIIVASGFYTKSHEELSAKTKTTASYKWLLSDQCISTDDDIVRTILNYNLDDRSNPINVLYSPRFISKKDGMPFDYLGLVSACDLGVFPSLYEPWGYTGLEALAFGIPVILGKQSGLGDYFLQQYANPSSAGVFLLDRENIDLTRQAKTLANLILQFFKHYTEYKKNAVKYSSQDINLLDFSMLLNESKCLP